MQHGIILINDNLYRPFINRENGADTDLYYMASCFRDRKRVRDTRFERHLTAVKKESFYRSRKQWHRQRLRESENKCVLFNY